MSDRYFVLLRTTVLCLYQSTRQIPLTTSHIYMHAGCNIAPGTMLNCHELPLVLVAHTRYKYEHRKPAVIWPTDMGAFPASKSRYVENQFVESNHTAKLCLMLQRRERRSSMAPNYIRNTYKYQQTDLVVINYLHLWASPRHPSHLCADHFLRYRLT